MPRQKAQELESCRSKVKRANEHILNLQLQTMAFLRAHPNRVRQEYDPKHDRIILFFDPAKTLPADFANTIGEAVHQLRSTLDHLIYQLIVARSKKLPIRKSQFPVIGQASGARRDPADEYKAVASRVIKGISPTAKAIIDSLQPFHRGATYQKDPLWILNKLSNTDKHRLPLALTPILALDFMLTLHDNVIKVDKFGYINGYLKLSSEDRTVFSMLSTGGHRKKDMEGKLSFTIAFEEIGDAKFEPVIPLLTQLSDHVSGIIELFVPEFT